MRGGGKEVEIGVEGVEMLRAFCTDRAAIVPLLLDLSGASAAFREAVTPARAAHVFGTAEGRSNRSSVLFIYG